MATNAEAFFQSLPTAAEIDNLIGTSEDLYFDAKVLLNETFAADSDRRALAKAVSAFANADGGVIVYGLEAKRDSQGRDVVQTANPLKDVELVRSKILGLVGQFLQPPVEGIVVESRKRSDGSGYVLVLVPPSASGPHRSMPQREYFRRHGSSSLPLEHYELEEMFGRRKRPRLELSWRVKDFSNLRSIGSQTIVIIGLTNVGRGIAKYPGLVLKNCAVWLFGFDGNSSFGLPALPSSNPRHLRYGGSVERVIYPGVQLDVTAIVHPIKFAVQVGDQTATCDDLVVEYELYAEDMTTVVSTLRVPADEILRLSFPTRYFSRGSFGPT